MRTLSPRRLFIVFSIFVSIQLCSQEQIAVLQEPFVMLLDPIDGSITNPSFIDLSPLNPGTPKALAQIDDEIWITDQLEDRIDIFNLEGNYLSTISVGLDNIKGLAYVNGEVWVTNSGSNNGAPGDAIIRFDTDGNNLGFIDTAADSSFDIIDVDGEVYISYINTGSRIERRDYNGTVLGNVVPTGVVSFIQQIEVNTANNSVYAAVFSTAGANASGLYEFNISDGTILNYFDVGALRGVTQLQGGDLLISGSAGVDILDPDTGVTTSISTTSSQYFGSVSLTPCTTPPTPTGEPIQEFVLGQTIEDIVVSPDDVTWFATEEDAMTGNNPLSPGTELQDGMTYYAVSIVDDCLSEPFAVTAVVLLSLEDFNNVAFQVAPNPVSDFLYIDSSRVIKGYDIYNLLGQRIKSVENFNGGSSIDVQSLPENVYILVIHFDTATRTIKFIKTN